MSSNEELLLEHLISVDEPQSLNDLCEALGITKNAVNVAAKKLVDKGEVVAVTASKNRKYYIANNEGITAGDYSKLKTKTLEMVVPVKAATDDAKDELQNMRKEIKNVYANIISIMAVFVAIFSIVFAGGNLMFQIANEAWTCHTLVAFLVAEAGIVFAIIIMLIGVKIFLK